MEIRANPMSQHEKGRLERSPDSQETESPFGDPVVLPIEDSIGPFVEIGRVHKMKSVTKTYRV
jgi:hypothetical protein